LQTQTNPLLDKEASMLCLSFSLMSRSYQEFLRSGYVPGRDFRVTYGDNRIEQCLLIAPRGGGIAPGSSEIMRAVAEAGGWAWYEFAGFLRQGNRAGFQVASADFDEPTLLGLLPRTAFATVFHGSGPAGDPLVYVGGLWTEGREIVVASMNRAFEKHGIRALDAAQSRVSEILQGSGARDLANRGKLRAGVQLEFSREARNLLFPPDASREARGRRSARLRHLARCLHQAIEQMCPLAAQQLRREIAGAV
jgi:phage replication-related protein YjqB (UPF0714/DUF867 family)